MAYNIVIKNIYSELETLPLSVRTTCDGVFLYDLRRHVSASLKNINNESERWLNGYEGLIDLFSIITL